MATEARAQTSRPRPWLLIALAVVAGLFLLLRFWPGGPAAQPTRAPARTAAKPAVERHVDPEDLKVRLEALEQEHPAPGESERNPFRFQPKPPPAPPPAQRSGAPASAPPLQPMVPPGPTGPPPPPPIPLKFIGIVQADAVGKVAAFTDCRATFQGREGSVIDGRYRLVRIGVQSVEMEYLDGRGRTTIRMAGDCPGR